MLRTIKRIGLTTLIIATGFALIFVLLIFLSINRFPETSLKYIDNYLLTSFDINYEKIPELCEKLKIKKNLINPSYWS